jgi:hypothetical protein
MWRLQGLDSSSREWSPTGGVQATRVCSLFSEPCAMRVSTGRSRMTTPVIAPPRSSKGTAPSSVPPRAPGRVAANPSTMVHPIRGRPPRVGRTVTKGGAGRSWRGDMHRGMCRDSLVRSSVDATGVGLWSPRFSDLQGRRVEWTRCADRRRWGTRRTSVIGPQEVPESHRASTRLFVNAASGSLGLPPRGAINRSAPHRSAFRAVDRGAELTGPWTPPRIKTR